MDLNNDKQKWAEKLRPILELYKDKKHPLNYQNPYQLMIMVILSAQDSDANINKIAPSLFEVYPNLESMSVSNTEALIPYISKVRNFGTKASWLIQIAQELKEDKNISTNLSDLIALKGIGRKSANVILRETNQPAEGIIADLHVIRVAPRIGIINESKDGNKVEKQLMEKLPKEIWGEIGMSISFLGREICRPTNPKCDICPLNNCCNYYKSNNL
ncbi:endonuclease III domain-containing protein [Flavobacterium capsici]|uniref:Endonuclease III n=1 Tax=Flavobacterium capsici TaxID=3075618 RepID=A0AA96F4N0_9FLAO|nr:MULTISPECIES: endonuclease III [unclassified Flavobacterium]WNM18661.1 endonuclease III [Flavobacterium sp. PMR2A8]WNM22712.1 endonuclease III [Flavobacterium sp. PMTSA4]